MRAITLLLLCALKCLACCPEGVGEGSTFEGPAGVLSIVPAASRLEIDVAYFGKRETLAFTLYGDLELIAIDPATSGLILANVTAGDESFSGAALPEGLQLRDVALDADQAIWLCFAREAPGESDRVSANRRVDLELRANLLVANETWAPITIPLALSMELGFSPTKGMSVHALGRGSSAQPTFPVSTARVELDIKAVDAR